MERDSRAPPGFATPQQAEDRSLREIFAPFIRLQRWKSRCGMFGSLVAKPKAKAMRMNFGEVLDIKDLGKHSAVTVIRLGILLAGTVNVTPDPKRKNFYEVEGGSTVYYIYVSPVTGTISLIATWKNITQLMPQLDFVRAAHS